jgi:chemotaxis protein histidine kinase CheA
MGDMFSYGVCCLFACCLPPTVEAQQQDIRRFREDGRTLSPWLRDKAKHADEHLPDLLESLLAGAATNEEALARRLSAKQTLLHPFHDPEAALAAVTRKQREAEAEAQRRRRQLEEREEALEEASEKTAREADCLRIKEKALEDKKKAITAQEEAAAKMEKEAALMKDAAVATKIAAKEEAKKEMAKVAAAQQALKAEQKEIDQKKEELQKECDKLEKERKEARAMPDYWEKSIVSRSRDRFAAIALDRTGSDCSTCTALEKLLETDPVKLKQGGADRGPVVHDRLKLACAWRLENPALWEKYMVGVQGVMNDMKRIRQGGVTATGGAPPITRRVADALPGDLRVDVNEAFLMHGTNSDALSSILSTGLNERFAGTAAGAAYGEGSYLAEDAGKNDQYTKVDLQYNGSLELHKRLYRHGARHQGKVFYILVCRVALGHHVRTQQPGRDAMSTDTGQRVFPQTYRELDKVAGVFPPVHHHSLLADVMDVGARYREFIVFHSEYIYPEYLVAYQRYEGDRGPLE